MKHLTLKLFFLFFLSIWFSFQAQTSKYQMRAAWIATVTNIDWPSDRNLTVEQQKKEMIVMLDSLQLLNMNAVVFQIRPSADALFVSNFEPWSQWFMGEQGKKPTPFYDPLSFLIKEAHARSMEVHVWLNPYRAIVDETQPIDKQHAFYQKKHLIKKYGDRYYFDPGYKETRDYLNNIVADVVMRYDVDAIHFDDYFYPYKIKKEEFPDEDSFLKEPRGFSKLKKDDWRRNNVDLVIAELQQTIKSIKPWVEFGISPFGVWRNIDKDSKGSKTRAGVTNYDDLYADILKWLELGIIDYVVPQLYWEIGKEVADYQVLIDWWAKNSYNKNLYIGLYASGLNNSKISAWKNGNELVRQMELNKKYPQQQGLFFFSARPMLKNPMNICDTLKNYYFKYPALVPLNKNIKGEASPQPSNLKVIKEKENVFLTWDKIVQDYGKQVAYYLVYVFKGHTIGDLENPTCIVAKTTDNFLDVSECCKNLKGEYTFVVTSVNRYKYESEAKEFVVKKF